MKNRRAGRIRKKRILSEVRAAFFKGAAVTSGTAVLFTGTAPNSAIYSFGDSCCIISQAQEEDIIAEDGAVMLGTSGRLELPYWLNLSKQSELPAGAESSGREEAYDPWTKYAELFGAAEPIPVRYSSVESGRRPVVKSQGSYGTCWALAATTALEVSLLPREHIVFSADHMALNNAFSVPVDDGGDYLMTMAYLSGWQGPVTEEEDLYGDAYSPEGLEPAVHVQEMQLYSGASKKDIKDAVYRYGAVQTSLYMNRKTTEVSQPYYNPWTFSYYDSQEHVQDHDIVILGWDDNASRFLFRDVPGRDGAWICQNSWGEEFGQNGIFYVSYEDVNIGRSAIAYTGIESTDNYDRIYQTDDCGWQGSQGYGDDTCWIANTYQAESEEELKAVGLYAVGEDTSWEIYLKRQSKRRTAPDGRNEEAAEVVSGSSDEESAQAVSGSSDEESTEAVSGSQNGEEADGDSNSLDGEIPETDRDTEQAENMEYLQSAEAARPGYYTVTLDIPQTLKPNEFFTIIVKIKTPGVTNPAAVEYKADQYTQNVTTEEKYGYLSHDGKDWIHTEERYGTNICLKAYTCGRVRQ